MATKITKEKTEKFLENKMIDKTNKESDMWKLYRFAEKVDEVNWNARYKPNNEFLSFMMPYMLNYAEESIKKVTFEKKDLRAVVGLSGGLDSCVSALLVANAMFQGINLGSSEKGRLVLMTFNAMSQEDLEYGRMFGNYLNKKFQEIKIKYIERDLRSLMKTIHNFTEETIRKTRGRKIYPGELSSRLMNLVTLEYADKTGHCCVDSTNGSEIVLGEIVLGSGFEYSPLSDLYKSQVFDIAEFLDMPKYIVNRNPINSTFGIDKIHSYFGEIPNRFSARDIYAVLDPVLFHIFDKKMKPRVIARKLGHSIKFVERVYQRFKNQDHRRKPPYFALNDRRMNFARTIADRPNKDFNQYLEGCFLE